MSIYADREAFIPYRKADVVELCVEDGKLKAEDEKKFREFCEIVGAYYHFEYHHELEALKSNFSAFDPDADTKPRVIPSEAQKHEMHAHLMQDFEKVLQRANYRKLTDEEWKKAKEQESLITLRMDVDMNDYESFTLYHRGSTKQTAEIKKLFGLKKAQLTMDVFERVVLLIKFKDEEYFLKKLGSKKKVKALNFSPGKTYIYMYKNIPQADLEIIFPNVEISMNLQDRLLFWVPAAGAGLATLAKVIPSLFIIGGILGVMLGFMQDEYSALIPTPEEQQALSMDTATPEQKVVIQKINDGKFSEITQADEKVLTETQKRAMKKFKAHFELETNDKDEQELIQLQKNPGLSDAQKQAIKKIQLKQIDLTKDEEAGLKSLPSVTSLTESQKEAIKKLNAKYLEQKSAQKQKQLIAALSGLAVLIGFVIKQYVAYKNKRIQFLKQVADTLFFKDLVCNAGVFNSLIDAAEDEQCKQIYLAYYHLLTSGSMSKDELDDLIEGWLEKKFSTKIDFDVEQALKCLTDLKGKVVAEGQDESSVAEQPIIRCDEAGKYHALKMDDAKTVVDYIWDNIFQYN